MLFHHDNRAYNVAAKEAAEGMSQALLEFG
jgi:hypothetical protein